jgi:hypothetical protein
VLVTAEETAMRRSQLYRFATTPITLVTIFCIALPALAATTLSPDEIKATFATGKPFASASPAGAQFTIVLNQDGSASRTPKGSKNPTLGKWRASDVGYCSTWGSGAENCYTIEQNGSTYSVRDSKGKLAARWTR